MRAILILAAMACSSSTPEPVALPPVREVSPPVAEQEDKPDMGDRWSAAVSELDCNCKHDNVKLTPQEYADLFGISLSDALKYGPSEEIDFSGYPHRRAKLSRIGKHGPRL